MALHRGFRAIILLTVVLALAAGFFIGAGPAPAAAEDRFRVLDISERTYEQGPAIAVILSEPLDPTVRHDEHLRISDPQQMLKSAWVLSEDGRVLYFPHVEPETEYSVSVLETLESARGEKLDQRYYQAVTTRRVTPGVSFASDGLILPEELADGLPVATVNVKTVDLEFFRINEKGLRWFVRWRNSTSRHDYGDINRAKEYGEFVFSGRFDLTAPANKRIVNHIPVKNIPQLQEPGVYFVVMRQPGEYDYDYQASYFIVTDIGLHARAYQDQTLFVTSSLKTGGPLAGVKLELFDQKVNTLWRGLTDEAGRAVYPQRLFSDKVSFLLAENEGRVAVLPLDTPALDLSEFDLGGRRNQARELFVYSPRDLYRPGETVVLSALARNYDGRPVKNLPLKAALYRPDGRKVRSFTWQPDMSIEGLEGYYQTRLALSGDSQTGRYRLELRDDPASAQPARVFHFQVEDFMPERMRLTLDSQQDRLMGQAPFQVDVLGEYLYGAPAAGNRLSGYVRVKAARQLFDKWAGYEFGQIKDERYREDWEFERRKLDEQGRTVVEIESRWHELVSPMSVMVTAELFETGGRPVTRAMERVYWPAKSLVGIRPEFEGDTVDEGLVGFEVIRAAPDGSLRPSEGLLITVIKEERDYYWEYSGSRGWRRRYSEKIYDYQTDTLALDGQKPGEYKIQLPSGRYVLSVRDPETGLISSVRFSVGWWWWYGDDARTAARPDKVELRPDRPSYQPGDVVKLQVTPPAAGDGLIMVEGDGVLWSQRVSVPAEGTVVEIPVSAAWDSHNLYVSAVIFRPGSAGDKITPNRAVGLVHLNLDRTARRLDVAIEAPEKVSPIGETAMPVSLKLAQGRPAGEPVFVTLAAVDVGILNITDFETPDPFAWFFEPRRYEVDAYDIYDKVIELMDGPTAGLRYGGGADMAPGGKRPETEVRLLTLFSGPVAFDADGNASVDLNLPADFNGLVRLMAVAFSPDSFGSAEAEVTVAAPIVTQMAMPRLLSPGDVSELALDVHNMSGQDRELEVTLTASHPLEVDQAPRTLSLKNQEKTTLRYPVRALGDFAAGTITMALKSEGIELTRDWKLPVRPGYPGLARKVRAVVRPGETFTLDPDLIDDLMPATIEADLKISTVLPLNVRQSMKDLIGYPHGCLEQTTSRAWPLLYATPDNLRRFNLPLIETPRTPGKAERRHRAHLAHAAQQGRFRFVEPEQFRRTLADRLRHRIPAAGQGPGVGSAGEHVEPGSQTAGLLRQPELAQQGRRPPESPGFRRPGVRRVRPGPGQPGALRQSADHVRSPFGSGRFGTGSDPLGRGPENHGRPTARRKSLQPRRAQTA